MEKLRINHIKVIIGVLIGAILIAGFIYFYKEKNITQLTYKDFVSEIENGQVEKVEISNGAKMRIQLKGAKTMYITDNPRKADLKEDLLIRGIDVVEAGEPKHFCHVGILAKYYYY